MIFSVAEICLILEKTEGIVKYLLQDGRKTMMDIFDNPLRIDKQKRRLPPMFGT